VLFRFVVDPVVQNFLDRPSFLEEGFHSGRE
jgi:hypothetical protein